MNSEQKTKPYLLNAFSVNQLVTFPSQVYFKEITCEEARHLLENGFISAVGHEQTVLLYEQRLGMAVPLQRINIGMEPGAWAVLGQYRGPRLTEGSMELPEGASIQWYCVKIK